MNIAQQLWPQHQFLHPAHLHPAFLHSTHLEQSMLDHHHMWLGRLQGRLGPNSSHTPGSGSFTIDAILGNKATKSSRMPKQMDYNKRKNLAYSVRDGRIKTYGFDNNRNRPDCDPRMNLSVQNMQDEDNRGTLLPYQYDHSQSSSFADGAGYGSEVHCKNKRVRTIFTPDQLERLEAVFHKQQYMVGTERYYLAASLNLSEAQVKVWFQNRRIKWRKQQFEMEHHRFIKSDIFQQNNSQLSEMNVDFIRNSDRSDGIRNAAMHQTWMDSNVQVENLDPQSGRSENFEQYTLKNDEAVRQEASETNNSQEDFQPLDYDQFLIKNLKENQNKKLPV